jgi:hypothetical protein
MALNIRDIQNSQIPTIMPVPTEADVLNANRISFVRNTREEIEDMHRKLAAHYFVMEREILSLRTKLDKVEQERHDAVAAYTNSINARSAREVDLDTEVKRLTAINEAKISVTRESLAKHGLEAALEFDSNTGEAFFEIVNVRAQVLEKEVMSAQLVAESHQHAFKNFHRNLCERFGYHHDEVHWERDQASLEEYLWNIVKNNGSLQGVHLCKDNTIVRRSSILCSRCKVGFMPLYVLYLTEEGLQFLESRGKDIASLRASLIDIGRTTYGLITDDVSNEFLTHVPENVKGYINGLREVVREEQGKQLVDVVRMNRYRQALNYILQNHPDFVMKRHP